MTTALSGNLYIDKIFSKKITGINRHYIEMHKKYISIKITVVIHLGSRMLANYDASKERIWEGI